MLPGKRDFYRRCKARRSASQVNKEFPQQFQNYAPPSLRVIRTKFARTIIYNWRASEASETLSGLFNRDRGYIYYIYTRKNGSHYGASEFIAEIILYV